MVAIYLKPHRWAVCFCPLPLSPLPFISVTFVFYCIFVPPENREERFSRKGWPFHFHRIAIQLIPSEFDYVVLGGKCDKSFKGLMNLSPPLNSTLVEIPILPPNLNIGVSAETNVLEGKMEEVVLFAGGSFK